MNRISAPVEKRALNSPSLWRSVIRSVIPASCAFWEEIRSGKRGGWWRGWCNFQAWQLFFFHAWDTCCLKGPDCIFHLLQTAAYIHQFFIEYTHTRAHTHIKSYLWWSTSAYKHRYKGHNRLIFFFVWYTALHFGFGSWDLGVTSLLSLLDHLSSHLCFYFFFLATCLNISVFNFPYGPFGVTISPVISLLDYLTSHLCLYFYLLVILQHVSFFIFTSWSFGFTFFAHLGSRLSL